MYDLLADFDHIGKPQITQQEWMTQVEMTLVTQDNIAACIDRCLQSTHVAVDVETEGLDNRVVFPDPNTYGRGVGGRTIDTLVGVCLSPHPDIGYYIPLRHTVGSEFNVPWTVFEREFRRLCDAQKAKKLVFVFHHALFDMEFLEYPGGSEGFGSYEDTATWEDTLPMIALIDSRRKSKGLKVLTKEFLQIEQIELEALFGEEEKRMPGFRPDFSKLDPSWNPAKWYGCSDAICTLRLFYKFQPEILKRDTDGVSLNGVYKIEKLCVLATRWMKRCRIHVDKAKCMELIKLGQAEWKEAVQDVYREAHRILGRDVEPAKYKILWDSFKPDDPNMLLPEQMEAAESRVGRLGIEHSDPKGNIPKRINGQSVQFPPIYDINSPQQLGKLFQEMEVPGLVFTELSGQVKTSRDEIDRIIEESEDEFPFMPKIKRFREITKAITSYLIPMLRDSDPDDDTMGINFNPYKTDTGRFATPAKENGEARVGWPQVNLQAVPAGYDPKRPQCMLRIRECITARKKGWFIVAPDYSGVELRLVTNLSNEPKWLYEYFHCSSCDRLFNEEREQRIAPPVRCPNCGSDKIGDLHTLTALKFFGEDAANSPDWKNLRQLAKSSNFGLCYGGSENAIVRAAKGKMPKAEAKKHKTTFDSTFSVLKRWWGDQHKFARVHKFVRTAFGRKCPLPDIDNMDGGFRSKAERNAVNAPVQGSSADITKLAMGLIYREVGKRGWWDKVYMIITMHDELVFEVDGTILEEFIEVTKEVMTKNAYITGMNWPVPLTSDVEVGYSWAVPWNIDSIRYGEVRFQGDKKIKDAKKAEELGLDWDSLSRWPASLEPLFLYKTLEGLPEAVARWMGKVYNPPTVSTNATEIPTDSGSKESAPNPERPNPERPNPERSNKDYTFTLYGNRMTLAYVTKLLEVIRECDGGGTRHLKLVLSDGSPLEGWNPTNGPILINEGDFESKCKEHNLV